MWLVAIFDPSAVEKGVWEGRQNKKSCFMFCGRPFRRRQAEGRATSGFTSFRFFWSRRVVTKKNYPCVSLPQVYA